MRRIILFGTVYVSFFVILILSFCIPDSLLQQHITESKDYISTYEQDNWYAVFSERDAVLDNTDLDMLDLAIYNGDLGEISAVRKACYINGYSRFWHGYIVVLRVLLVFLNYTEIRYYNMLFLLLLFGLNLILFSKRLGRKTAVAFLLAMGMGRFFIAAYCFSYMVSFAIAFIAIYYILKMWNCLTESRLFSLFMFIGMAENFFDFLTTPLLTWGLPVMVVILLSLDNGREPVARVWKKLFFCSLFWLSGYASMWFMKWLTGTVVLRSNLFEDALNSIIFRISGDEQYSVDYSVMLAKNISYISLPNIPWEIFMAVISMVWIIFFIFSVKRGNDPKRILLFVLIALCPYVWYVILANHSQIHAIFTYKLQMVSLFSFFTSFSYCMDWDNRRAAGKKGGHCK